MVLFGSAILWAAWHWSASPFRAIAGAVAIVFSYAVVLALQCVFLWHVSRGDSAPRPGGMDLLRAWWAEVLLVPPVFFWRQPFAWREIPDFTGPSPDGLRGVVLVHGFVCNRGIWNPWLRIMRAQGRPFVAVNLEPVFGSIDAYPARIDEAVRELQRATGKAPVLVCHSMGGLAARAWLRSANDPSRVHHVVTIGSPHRGTWLGRFSSTHNGSQMRLASGWLAELEQWEALNPAPAITCWYSHCDHIVFPTSSGMLPGADNRLILGPAHVELAFVPEVIEQTFTLADTPRPPVASM